MLGGKGNRSGNAAGSTVNSFRPSGTSLGEGGKKGSLLRELSAPTGAD